MRTILIIDDDIAIGNMEQEVLERVGYTTPGYFSRLYKKYKGHTPEGERMSKS